jgi:adenylate kinase
MNIFLTAVSECDKKGFVEDTVRIAKLNGKEVNYISMGDMLMDKLKSNRNITYNTNKILNMPPEHRATHIEGIIKELKSEIDKHEHNIITGHAVFYWKNVFTNAFNCNCLKDLNPDMYITLIDNAEKINQNMESSPQFHSQQYSTEKILAWQNVEVITTQTWAQYAQKDHFILPRHNSNGLLYKLMFHPEIELVYASFPMSHIKSQKTVERIDNFVKKLDERFATITPRSIELSKKFVKEDGSQTVLRDTSWWTSKVKKVIAYYATDEDEILPPEEVKLPFSAGVWTEIKEGHDTTKDIYGIFPRKDHYGPFEEHYLENLFFNEEAFFKQLDKEGYKKHNIKM